MTDTDEVEGSDLIKKLGAGLALVVLATFAGAVAALTVSAAQTPPGWQIRHYTTGDSAELATAIPVTVANGDAYVVVYCLDLGDEPAGGEILQVDAHMQVTLPHTDTVAFNSHIYLASSCADTAGTEITEAQGTNLDRSIHHLNVNRSGSITVGSDNTHRYIVLLAWSASSTAKPGDSLLIDQDYGRLSAVRFTPA